MENACSPNEIRNLMSKEWMDGGVKEKYFLPLFIFWKVGIYLEARQAKQRARSSESVSWAYEENILFSTSKEEKKGEIKRKDFT
ncbi:hypothetical protein CEXT_488451 [Caerostris extrusa]|uniref:Ycf15 n=1 Tax=Caerostris extrusa TaxID=172846 RepID=A0AAV4RQL5_CAEEX|nr:hypothetical protein CEXT_488451 [Caerostris extrusa]